MPPQLLSDWMNSKLRCENEWKLWLSDGFSTLIDSEEYSELTIVYGKNRFKAHRAIVCPQSEFFKAACKPVFKEGHTRIIELQDDDETTVGAMLKFMYDGDYSVFEGKSRCEHGNSTHDLNDSACYLWPVGLSLSMCQIADKYGVEALQNASLIQLTELLSLKLKAIDDHWIIIEEIFRREGVPDEILELTKDFLAGKLCNKLFDEDLRACKGFEDFSLRQPELALDLVRQCFSDSSKEAGSCGGTPGIYVHVANLPYSLDEDDIKKINLFSYKERPDRIELECGIDGQSHGTAILEYADINFAKAAISKLNGFEILGQTLRVGFASRFYIPFEGPLSLDRYSDRFLQLDSSKMDQSIEEEMEAFGISSE